MHGLPNGDGKCVRCNGTKKCHTCNGSGKHPTIEGVNCPTCRNGDGICKFCPTEKRVVAK